MAGLSLRWQEGYGVLSLRKDEIGRVSLYIDRQEEHHRRGTVSNLPERASKFVVKIKICGITNLEDARSAVKAGADMLGFNFYPASPRFIEPKNARAIVDVLRSEKSFLNHKVVMVGVFVDESSPEAIAHTAQEVGLDAVQLHGDDSFAFCEAVKDLLPDCLLIKVLRVDEKFQPAEAKQYAADVIMLDAFHPELRGGTGKKVDWKKAREIAEAAPRLFLAGGLAPENVAAAIEEVRPYGVDACTSLESSPGKKDAERMKEFVRAAHTE